jgi:shikimate kinase
VKRHIVLVGLPGSGKTTVGWLTASLLSTPFSDIDEKVVAAAGMPVAEIFRLGKEAQFRRIERATMDGAIAAEPHVISPGAGWIAQPGNLEAAGEAVLLYLRISPEAAAERLQGDTSRPLLAGGDLLARMKELHAQRDRWYRRAHTEVDAAMPPDAVAAEVVRAARSFGGW